MSEHIDEKLFASTRAKSGFKYVYPDNARCDLWGVRVKGYQRKGYPTPRRAAIHYSKTFHPKLWQQRMDKQASSKKKYSKQASSKEISSQQASSKKISSKKTSSKKISSKQASSKKISSKQAFNDAYTIQDKKIDKKVSKAKKLNKKNEKSPAVNTSQSVLAKDAFHNTFNLTPSDISNAGGFDSVPHEEKNDGVSRFEWWKRSNVNLAKNEHARMQLFGARIQMLLGKEKKNWYHCWLFASVKGT